MLITYKVKDKRNETFSDLYNLLINGGHIKPLQDTKQYNTIYIDTEANLTLIDKLKISYNIPKMQKILKDLADEYRISIIEPVSFYYDTFRIPKHSGGYREISAPHTTLKRLLKKTLYIFQYKLFVLSHNSAYAFNLRRNTKESLKVHQANRSNWFLKLDIKDFFPSFTPYFILEHLKNLFPFSLIIEDEQTLRSLEEIINYCCLDGALPQGSPMSPLLTNVCMTSFDIQLQNLGLVYTRYADDMLFSSEYDFNYKNIQKKAEKILTPNFQINTNKTRYGSSSGRNWNLGLMLNKDNEITIGWRNKKLLKAKLTNLPNLNETELQQLKGLISYYKMVEMEYISYLIQKYETKFNFKL